MIDRSKARPSPALDGVKLDEFYDCVGIYLFYCHPDSIAEYRRLSEAVSAQTFSQQAALDIDELATKHLLVALMGYLHDPDHENVYAALEQMILRLQELCEQLARHKVVPYADYLKTSHWEVERQKAVERARHRCQLCNSDKRLNVHHRSYDRLFGELPEDLIVLCRGCHAKFHDKLP